MAEIASSSGKLGSQAVDRPDRAIDVAHAHVHVQRERVVAPGHVLQALLDTAVVLGVDDPLLAVVSPRMRARGTEREALAGGKREQPRAPLALARERVVQVAADPRDDLDLR